MTNARFPVSREQWGSVVVDIESAFSDLIGDTITPKSAERALGYLLEDLAHLRSFECVSGEALRRADKLIWQWLDHTTAMPRELPEWRQEIVALVEGLAPDQYEFPIDVWKHVFGISRHHLLNPDGAVNPGRLLAAFYLKVEDFYQRLNPLIATVGFQLPVLTTTLAHVMVLLLESQRPIWLCRGNAAISTRLQSLAVTADTPVNRPVTASEARDESESFDSLEFTLGLIGGSMATREQARMRFDSYRQASEGRLKPWLFFLREVRADQKHQTMLGSLRKGLLSSQSSASRVVGSLIKTSWRNASAHEDIHFDDNDQLLDVSGQAVDMMELESFVAQIQSFAAGCELALIASETREVPDLITALVGSGEETYAASVRRSRDNFGDNGIAVSKVRLERGSLSVTVDALSMNQVDPSFQAIVLSKMQTGRISSARVIVKDERSSVLRVSNASIGPTVSIWKSVRTYSLKNPGATFVPMNFEARRYVEDDLLAFSAISWILINDMIRAYDDHGDFFAASHASQAQVFRGLPNESPRELLQGHKYLLRRFRTCQSALAACLAVCPGVASPDVNRLQTALTRRIDATGHAIRDAGRRVTLIYEPSDLIELRGSIPVPAVAPSTDKSPIPI